MGGTGIKITVQELHYFYDLFVLYLLVPPAVVGTFEVTFSRFLFMICKAKKKKSIKIEPDTEKKCEKRFLDTSETQAKILFTCFALFRYWGKRCETKRKHTKIMLFVSQKVKCMEY
jgi:hypothetical protein